MGCVPNSKMGLVLRIVILQCIPLQCHYPFRCDNDSLTIKVVLTGVIHYVIGFPKEFTLTQKSKYKCYITKSTDKSTYRVTH